MAKKLLVSPSKGSWGQVHRNSPFERSVISTIPVQNFLQTAAPHDQEKGLVDSALIIAVGTANTYPMNISSKSPPCWYEFPKSNFPRI